MKTFTLINFITCYAFKSHTFLGSIADIYLSKNYPEIYQKITDDLQGNSIANISTWADKVKMRRPWTKKLHYIDILECKTKINEDIVDKYCSKGCIVNTIIDYTLKLKDNLHNFQNKLLNFQSNLNEIVKHPHPEPNREEKLKFLIHFMQDFNQPLHLLGYDKGGNNMKIIVNRNKRNRSTNMHELWDEIIPEYYIKFDFKDKVNFKVNDNDNIRDLIYKTLNVNLKIACKIYPTPNTTYIIFEDYYNEEYIHKLFNNYLTMIVNIMKYIYM
jgi:S1/P1 Nuclease